MPLLPRLLALAALAATLTLADPAGAAPGRTVLLARAETLVSGPLTAFLAAKAATLPPFDWSDDGCSVVPDRPLGFDFHDACLRHDFGYRNFGAGGLALDPSPARRARLDERLRADLATVCARMARVRRTVCSALALTYYEGARLLGSPAFTR
jgi:hypothetical protein